MRILVWTFRIVSLLIFFLLVLTYVSFRVTHLDGCAQTPLRLLVKTLSFTSRIALRCER